MSDHFEGTVLRGKVELPFSFTAGRTASRFFVELRDHKRIMGKRCPQCNKVIVPAQLVCKECFVETDDWVEVGPEGTVITFTVVHRQEQHHPRKVPFAYGVIKLDGADTSIVHFLSYVDMDHIRQGMRVRAVFSEQRRGHILDIEGFRPI
ncbi:MAG: Zn-ribbon domain-containing OB-fold protein [Deltaproteobacteria bacterium]|nr:Zn-ribbon domain-containing OB-fold protein [Deltaproteobacteria bacterium]